MAHGCVAGFARNKRTIFGCVWWPCGKMFKSPKHNNCIFERLWQYFPAFDVWRKMSKCPKYNNYIFAGLIFFDFRIISAFLGQSPQNTIIVRKNNFIFFSSLFFPGCFCQSPSHSIIVRLKWSWPLWSNNCTQNIWDSSKYI